MLNCCEPRRWRRDRGPLGGHAGGARRPPPWLWEARARVARERALWYSCGAAPAPAPPAARILALQAPARPASRRPAPAVLLVYFSRPAPGRHSPAPALPRPATAPLHDPPAPAARPGRRASTEAATRGCFVARRPAGSRGAVPQAGTGGCQTCRPRLNRAQRSQDVCDCRLRATGWNPLTSASPPTPHVPPVPSLFLLLMLPRTLRRAPLPRTL